MTKRCTTPTTGTVVSTVPLVSLISHASPAPCAIRHVHTIRAELRVLIAQVEQSTRILTGLIQRLPDAADPLPQELTRLRQTVNLLSTKLMSMPALVAALPNTGRSRKAQTPAKAPTKRTQAARKGGTQ